MFPRLNKCSKGYNLTTFHSFQHGLFDLAKNKRLFMSRCCINCTLQLMQLTHGSDPSLFKAAIDAVEIKLKYSDRFPYMQHIPDHHLSIILYLKINSGYTILSLSVRAKLLLSSIYSNHLNYLNLIWIYIRHCMTCMLKLEIIV